MRSQGKNRYLKGGKGQDTKVLLVKLPIWLVVREMQVFLDQSLLSKTKQVSPGLLLILDWNLLQKYFLFPLTDCGAAPLLSAGTLYLMTFHHPFWNMMLLLRLNGKQLMTGFFFFFIFRCSTQTRLIILIISIAFILTLSRSPGLLKK